MTTLLVCSGGGHLQQMWTLRPRLPHRRRHCGPPSTRPQSRVAARGRGRRLRAVRRPARPRGRGEDRPHGRRAAQHREVRPRRVDRRERRRVVHGPRARRAASPATTSRAPRAPTARRCRGRSCRASRASTPTRSTRRGPGAAGTTRARSSTASAPARPRATRPPGRPRSSSPWHHRPLRLPSRGREAARGAAVRRRGAVADRRHRLSAACPSTASTACRPRTCPRRCARPTSWSATPAPARALTRDGRGQVRRAAAAPPRVRRARRRPPGADRGRAPPSRRGASRARSTTSTPMCCSRAMARTVEPVPGPARLPAAPGRCRMTRARVQFLAWAPTAGRARDLAADLDGDAVTDLP